VIKSLYYDSLDKVLNYYGRGWMLNISLPDRIIDFIERQAIADGFNTPSEYISHIILREQERLGQQNLSLNHCSLKVVEVVRIRSATRDITSILDP
jgi:hypothetical protein